MASYQHVLIGLRQRPISFLSIYAEITGSITGAAAVAVDVPVGPIRGRKFYKTDGQIMSETRLSMSELSLAKEGLMEPGLVSISKDGVTGMTSCKVRIAAVPTKISKT